MRADDKLRDEEALDRGLVAAAKKEKPTEAHVARLTRRMHGLHEAVMPRMGRMLSPRRSLSMGHSQV